MKSGSRVGVVGDYLMFGPDPQDVVAELQPDVEHPIVQDERTYAGLAFVYEHASPPFTTKVTLQPIGGLNVVSIVTTAIDGQGVETAWTLETEGWQYAIPQELFVGSHQIDFTVTWEDGKRHDPKIIINPTS